MDEGKAERSGNSLHGSMGRIVSRLEREGVEEALADDRLLETPRPRPPHLCVRWREASVSRVDYGCIYKDVELTIESPVELTSERAWGAR